MLAVCCVLVLAPLLSLRDLGRLGPMSTAGVVVAGGFAVSVVGITGIAIAKGQVGGARRPPATPCRREYSLEQLWRLLRASCRRHPPGADLQPTCLPALPCPSLPPSPFLCPLADFHWLPTAEMMGDTPSQVAVNLLAVLPVISLSFICQ